MLFQLSRKKRYANIEIKDHVIRFTEMKNSLPPKPDKIGEFILPEGVIKNGEIKDRLTFQLIMDEAVERWGIKRKTIQFLVPDQIIVVRKHQIPAYLSVEEIKGYLYIELGNSIHLPFEDPILDFTILQSNEEYHEVLLYAAPENVINEYKAIFESSKLKPITADLSSLSLFRLYQLMSEANQQENLMILKIDQSNATIGIYQKGLPIFIQNEMLLQDEDIKHNHDEHNNALIEPLNDLIDNIGRVIHFYKYNMMSGNADLNKIMLTGDHPFMQLAYNKLNDQYNYRITHMDYEIEQVQATEVVPSKYYACIGLGLKEV